MFTERNLDQNLGTTCHGADHVIFSLCLDKLACDILLLLSLPQFWAVSVHIQIEYIHALGISDMF